MIGKTTSRSEEGRSDRVNGWKNEFLLNWEVGMANKFDTDPVTMRAKGKYSLRLEQRNKSVVGNFSGNLVDSVVPYGFMY